jgi:hypothetical protein
MYGGKTVVKQDYLTMPINVEKGFDHFVIVAPMPGVAFWFAKVANGASLAAIQFTPVLYPDSESMFPNMVQSLPGDYLVSNTQQVDRFRTMTSAAELVCTTNNFNYAGALTAFKTPLALALANRSVTPSDESFAQELTGFDGVAVSVNSSQIYASDVKSGVYSVAFNREASFEFHDIQDGQSLNSQTLAPFGTSSMTSGANFVGPILGLDDFDSIVFKLSIPASAVDQSFFIRTWRITEYQPVQNSMLHQFSHCSPALDEIALLSYKFITANVPIGVPSAENESFWKRVLSIFNAVSGALAFIPGPVGEVAAGVHIAGSAISRAT